MDAQSLNCPAGSATFSRWNRFILFLAIVLTLLLPASVSAEIALPDRPPDYLVDQGGVLPPEKAREISAALNACARDCDIHIYIVTLPTLGVLPSHAREKLDEILETAKSKWMTGKAGALLVFDYETGQASMAESDEARKMFSSIAMNLVFADPGLQPSPKARYFEQLERGANALIKRFSNLRMRAIEEEKRRRANIRFFWALAGGTLLVVIATAVAKAGSATPRPESPQSTPKVTADE